MATRRVCLSSLIEDFDLYPRHDVDAVHVAELAEAITAGAKLPPPVIDEATMRIVDGWHRVRAWRRVLGEDEDITVELIRCQSEDELLLEAVRRNAAHGKRLQRIDQVRIIHMAEQRGIPEIKIRAALQITEDQARRLRVRIAVEKPTREPVVLKRALLHLSGRSLTAAQAAAVRSAPGTQYSLLVQQLLDAARHGFLDAEDERLRDLIEELVEALQEWLESAPIAV